MSNREKSIVVDALREHYPLKDILKSLRLSKSSCFYQKNARSKPDKYADLKVRISEVFNQNYRCYGYRRIRFSLRRKGIVVSEKVVRRLMRTEGLSRTKAQIQFVRRRDLSGCPKSVE